jgi:hypothetical protein
MFYGHLSMKPAAKHWLEEFQGVMRVEIHAMKPFQSTNPRDGQLIASPDDQLIALFIQFNLAKPLD